MTIDISLNDNLVDSINMQCSPVEFLVLNDALKMLANNRDISEKDRLVASKMVDVINKNGRIRE